VLRRESKRLDVLNKKNIQFPLSSVIGYMGYETVELFDNVKLKKQKDELKLPDAVFIFGSVFVVFDHYKDELCICALSEDFKADACKKVDAIIARLLDNDFRVYDSSESDYEYNGNFLSGKEEYISGVLKIKEEIVKGNLLQGVMSRRVKIKCDMPPIEAYARLRRINPSPYLFYLDFEEFRLFGASPELMVSYNDGIATIKPIAGTRPRGKDKEEDNNLECELLADIKERAEHLMLVDLARNDLGRIACTGSVLPKQTFFVERFSHVMHIVSDIEAKVKSGYDAYDVIKASFPAGTVSGAPKIKAIEILSRLEKIKRGPYAGLVGHMDIDGNFDSCIALRSFVHKDKNYYMQAGAGIVYDSVPEREFEETVNKLKALALIFGGSSK